MCCFWPRLLTWAAGSDRNTNEQEALAFTYGRVMKLKRKTVSTVAVVINLQKHGDDFSFSAYNMEHIFILYIICSHFPFNFTHCLWFIFPISLLTISAFIHLYLPPLPFPCQFHFLSTSITFICFICHFPKFIFIFLPLKYAIYNN